ncbi:hypothetical protein [Alistipes ihumii]|uniref:hypothetical protein n=1 Tax=Alistipes ihumii TaxID=1470347 RepID=UPI003AB4E7B7
MLYSSCKGIVRQIYIFFPCRQKKSCDRPEKMPLYPESPGPTDHFHSSPDQSRTISCPAFTDGAPASVRAALAKAPGPSIESFRTGFRCPAIDFVIIPFEPHGIFLAFSKKGYIFVVLIRNEDFLAVKRQESAAETAKCQLIQTPEYKRIKYAKGVICILIST